MQNAKIGNSQFLHFAFCIFNSLVPLHKTLLLCVKSLVILQHEIDHPDGAAHHRFCILWK